MADKDTLIRQMLVPGIVVSAQLPDELFATAMESASAPKVMTDGKPTIMLVEAWMLHEGKNNNGDVFRPEDLAMIAAQVAEPNFLPMDWNHSTRWGEGNTIGVWYRAERAWNAKAREGKGAWGVRAFGMMWAWAYPDFAQSLLADMERDGAASFSMMCVPKDVTYGRDASGYFTVMVEPTMYALSALSVDPGDPDALGVAVEGGAGEELSKKLDERVRRWQAAAVELFEPFAVATLKNDPQGATSMEKDELEKALAESLAANEALKAEKEAAEARLAEIAETERAAAEAAAAAESTESTEQPGAESPEADAAAPTEASAETEVDPAAGVETVEDVKVALDAMRDSLEQLQAERDREAAVVAELRTKLEAFQAQESADAFNEMRDARYNSLPEAYRKALSGRGETVVLAFKERWAKASVEQWDAFVEDITVANPMFRQSYRQMSEDEGGALPDVSSEDKTIAALVAKART